MPGFILRQNTARYTAVVKGLLAKVLRDYASFEANSAGLIVEIDIGQSQVQKTMFRNSLEASDDPHLLFDPRKALHTVDISLPCGLATMTSSAKRPEIACSRFSMLQRLIDIKRPRHSERYLTVEESFRQRKTR